MGDHPWWVGRPGSEAEDSGSWLQAFSRWTGGCGGPGRPSLAGGRGGSGNSRPSGLTACPLSLQLCEDLFSRINDTTNDNMSYSVEVGAPAVRPSSGALLTQPVLATALGL